MNDHLPECDAEIWMQEQMNDPYAPHWLEPPDDIECQCKKLRACEERVAEETEAAMMKFFYWKPSPPHDQHYFADNICAYCVGYWEALTAARKAVAAMPQYSMRDTCVFAIDELREEKK